MADAALARRDLQQCRSDVPITTGVDVEPRRNNTNSKIYIERAASMVRRVFPDLCLAV